MFSCNYDYSKQQEKNKPQYYFEIRIIVFFHNERSVHYNGGFKNKIIYGKNSTTAVQISLILKSSLIKK